MKVMVTGSTGFIGNKLSLLLAQKGYEVHALCRNKQHPNLPLHPNIRVFEGDILDKKSLHAAMKGCDQLYHTAAMAKMWCRNPDDFYQVNVVGTRNVLETAHDVGVPKTVYTSTCGVWGPTIKHPMVESDPRITGFPIHYERTKHLAELAKNEFVDKGLNVVTVNPSRVYGEGPITDSNTVSKMIKGYLSGKWRVIPGNGESVANYAYLDDVVKGHIGAMDYGIRGDRYILGGEDISFNQFFNTLSLASGQKRKLFKVPIPVIKWYSHAEWLKTKLTGLPPVFLPEFADRLRYDQKYRSDKAINQLRYQITPFEEGMKRTVNYLQNYHS